MLTGPLPWPYVLREIFPQTVVSIALSVGAVLLNRIAEDPEQIFLEGKAAEHVERLSGWAEAGIPFGAVAAMGGALAVFLAFRNSSAYDRWWEARKLWGAMVNDSRSWARQSLAWISDPALSRELIHRHLAFVHGMAIHLRKEPDLVDRIARFLPADELERLRGVPNVPTALLLRQGVRLKHARSLEQIDSLEQHAMDEMLTRLSDIQGACERIKNTPLPRQYDEIPRAFVYAYGAMVPFALVETVGWATVPVSVIITSLFLLLEAAGRVIENPFEGEAMDTPMTALSVTIERDLRAALDEPIPPAVEPTAYGLLM